MAVTISTTVNNALSCDVLISGTMTISGAKKDDTESLTVSLYNENTGATFTAPSCVYNTTQVVTFSYANGSIVSVNLSSGVWTYQRINSEIGNEKYKYIFTFTWTDRDGVQTSVVTVETTPYITINKFAADPLDDLDTHLTGTCDLTIAKPAGVNVSLSLTANSVSMTGTAQTLTTATDKLTWTLLDDTEFVLDLGKKSFSYTRTASSINDKKSDIYNITLRVGAVNLQADAISVVGSPPDIQDFTANATYDTDSVIRGNITANNAIGSTVAVTVSCNGALFAAETQTYADNLLFVYSNGTSFSWDTKGKKWSFERLGENTTDLRSDIYTFEVTVTNRYGSKSQSVSMMTIVPKVEIGTFKAENISDDEPYITGTLEYTMPAIARNPQIKVDVVSNGISYTADALPLGSQTISFDYVDGSKFSINPSKKTFTFTRNSQDVSDNNSDIYNFDLSITINGETVSQSCIAKSLSGQRVYDYEPAYPVNVAPGSQERQNTAWPKYVMEVQRIYRKFNDNLNYYETLAAELKKQVTDMKNYMDGRFGDYAKDVAEVAKTLASMHAKVVTGVAFHGDSIPLPNGSKREDCICIVSLNRWTNTHSDNKYTYDMNISVNYDNWTLVCYTTTEGRNGTGGTYPGYANYIVIDKTTLL